MTRPCLHRALTASAALLLALVPMGAGQAHSYRLGAIRIGHLWAKPQGHGSFAVYGPLFNSGRSPDVLTKVTSPAAKRTMIVQTRGGAHRIAALALTPGKPVSLASWSSHIELLGVGARKKGAMIPLTLTFAHAGTIKVAAMVETTPTEAR